MFKDKMFRIWSKSEGVNSSVILEPNVKASLPCIIQFEEAMT